MALTVDAYVPYAGEIGDKEVRVNHYGCKAGVDTKRRLYIRRRNDGAIVAYCHHCGEAGLFKKRYSPASVVNGLRQEARRGVQGKVELPKDVELDTTKWPAEARTWALRYLSEHEVKRHGIGFSAKYGRVILPIHNRLGMVGFQARRVLPDDDGPKYITEKVGDTLVYNSAVYTAPSIQGTVVFVEDILSAIVVGRVVNTYAILKGQVDNNVVRTLTEGNEKCVVWLDNDNYHIIYSQERIRQSARAVCGNVKVLRTSTDPKTHSTDEIVSLLTA